MPYSTRRQSRQLFYLLGGAALFLIVYIYSARRESSDPIYQKTKEAFLTSNQKEGFQVRQQQDVKNYVKEVEAHREEWGTKGAGPERVEAGKDRGSAPPEDKFEETRLGRHMKEAKERDEQRRTALDEADKLQAAELESQKDKSASEEPLSTEAKRKLPHAVKDVPSSEPLAVKDEAPSSPADILKTLIKQHPILLFSKTYCPHSAKAKRILLNNYSFTPEPFVVELDNRETNPPHDGRMLQEELKKLTGRPTVPNLLINGHSLGGGSEVEELSNAGELIKRVEEISKGSVRGTKPWVRPAVASP